MKKTKCLNCQKEISNNNFKKHVISCERPKKPKRTREQMLEHLKNVRPNSKPDFVPWNKGLNKESDERVRLQAEAESKTIKALYASGDWVPRSMSTESKKQLSKRMSENNPGGRCKWYEVSGIRVQGTWERDFAIFLNEKGIAWERGRAWKYVKEEKETHYTPDFFLPEFNTWVEIKGYWWGNDKEKMEIVSKQYPNRKILIIEDLDFENIEGLRYMWSVR